MVGAALACGQQPGPTPPKTEKVPEPPAKSKLEEMIDKALRDNPDVRLAAAKVAEAEAELTRARLLVVQKVASAYQAVEAQKAAVEAAEAEHKDVQTAYQAGRVDQATFATAKQKLLDAKAKLADLETQLPYLLGKEPTGDAARAPADAQRGAYDEFIRRVYLDTTGRLPTPEELALGASFKASFVQGPTADRIRAALDKPFTYDNKDQSIDSLIKALDQSLSEGGSGLIIKNNWTIAPNSAVGDVVKFDHIPIGAVLEWVEDDLPGYRAVVRDYGVVIVRKDDVPPGAPLLREFWKGANGQDKPEAKAWAPNPPPVLVEGVVKEVAKDGLVRLSVGSDAGLAKGNTLEVWRQAIAAGGAPLYVTRVRIVDISAAESVCKAMIPGNGYVQPGDKATSLITGGLPAKFVEGLVKDVDKDGLIHINLIGKSDGLAKDDVMTAIRQESENGRALLVGDVRVVEVKDGEAVAQPAGLTTVGPVRPGDKVRGPQK